MKIHHFTNRIFVAVALALVSCSTTQTNTSISASQPSKDQAQIVVTRVANFGENLTLALSIDGHQVAKLIEGRNYTGNLSPGSHVLTGQTIPHSTDLLPARKTVTLQGGRTYQYTARWSGSQLVFVADQ